MLLRLVPQPAPLVHGLLVLNTVCTSSVQQVPGTAVLFASLPPFGLIGGGQNLYDQVQRRLGSEGFEGAVGGNADGLFHALGSVL